MIRHVAVVVPANDEEQLLPECLESVRRAALHPSLRDVTVSTYVVADSCRDRTAQVAEGYGARVLQIAVRSAGSARAFGSAHALNHLLAPSMLSAPEVWTAHTDADSTVPESWLADQLTYAHRGFQAVVGTIEVTDWSDHLPSTALAYQQHYDTRDPAAAHIGNAHAQAHTHVHGANFAVRADAYTAVGGFPALAVGEDRALVRALQSAGHRIHRTHLRPVRTSARRTPRAAGGFGDYLLHLERTGHAP